MDTILYTEIQLERKNQIFTNTNDLQQFGFCSFRSDAKNPQVTNDCYRSSRAAVHNNENEEKKPHSKNSRLTFSQINKNKI